jgi:cytoskeletal protein CcmA (bactofilin family)
MFKKVIGQGHNEPMHSALPNAEIRRPEPVAVPAPAASYGTQPAATRNVLSADVEIKGTVKFTNDLVVDGKIEGEIFSDGNLIVGENARIRAEIKTTTVIVYGKVHGNLTATERVELKASAEVVGDIKTKTLSIEAGAIFVGKSTVGTPAQAPAQTSAPAAVTASTAPVTAKPTPTPEVPRQGTLAGTIS